LPEKCCPHHDDYQNDEEDEEEKNDCGNNCCSLEYQYVDADQLNKIQSYNHSTKVLSFHSFSHSLAHGLNAQVKECTFAVKNNSPPPELLKIPLIYMHSQLRL